MELEVTAVTAGWGDGAWARTAGGEEQLITSATTITPRNLKTGLRMAGCKMDMGSTGLFMGLTKKSPLALVTSFQYKRGL